MTSSAEVIKATQKVKEAMSRMNKNELAFCIVNLEAMCASDLECVGRETLKMKSGKDSYICTGKIICLVSYEEGDADNMDILTTKNRINILLNINQLLYSSIHAGYVGYSLEGKQYVRRDNWGTSHPELLNGLFHYLSNDGKCDTVCTGLQAECNATDVTQNSRSRHSSSGAMGLEFSMSGTSGGTQPIDENDDANYIYMNSYRDLTPFKTIDEVIKRFYDLMRCRGLLLDEEEEDLGAMADAAGIEW